MRKFQPIISISRQDTLDMSYMDRALRKERRLRKMVFLTERFVPMFLFVTSLIMLGYVITQH